MRGGGGWRDGDLHDLVLLTKYSVGKIKENEKERICCTCERQEKCLQSFREET